MYPGFTSAAYPFDEQEPSPEEKAETERRLQFVRDLNHDDIRILERLFYIEDIHGADIEQLKKDVEIIKNKLEKPTVYTSGIMGRAHEIRNKLYTMPRRNGLIFLDSMEVRHFLQFEIMEGLRLNKVRNPADHAVKTMRRAYELFPNELILDKSEFKHKKLRIRLRI